MKTKRRHRAWEKWEEDIIIEYYTKMPMKKFKKHLPHRSVAAIRERYKKITKRGDLPAPEKKKTWKDWEIEYIVKNYNEMSSRDIAKKLNVRITQLYSKTRDLRETGAIKAEEHNTDGKVGEKEKQAYKKLVEEDRDYGMAKELKELKFKKGKKYKVKAKIKQGNPVNHIFEGRLIKEYEEFILLEGDFKQCFLKSDLILGEYTIKEME